MQAYTQHSEKVVDRGPFEHIMALTLHPKNPNEGLVRCIKKRTGTVLYKGFVDKSVFYKVRSTNLLEHYEIYEPLVIKNSEKILSQFEDDEHYFIGLEDPDLVFDEETKLLHLYFTIPFLLKSKKDIPRILLGHAVGKNLDDLVMTEPVLSVRQIGDSTAKELSLAPINSSGVRLNLIETKDRMNRTNYSTVRIAKAQSLNSPWEWGSIVFHPKLNGSRWCAEHASPGPLLPQEFINIGQTKRVGLLNGREASTYENGKIKYGVFSVGLFIYDFEKGVIDWVSKESFIIDSEAKIITFASHFIQTKPNEGILYAHVDDSFVRAYTLFADQISEYLEKYINSN